MEIMAILLGGLNVLLVVAIFQKVTSVRAKLKAERHFIEMLHRERLEETKLLVERLSENSDVPDAELESFIRGQLARLREEQRHRLDEGLNQASDRGRRQYREKLLRSAVA